MYLAHLSKVQVSYCHSAPSVVRPSSVVVVVVVVVVRLA